DYCNVKRSGLYDQFDRAFKSLLRCGAILVIGQSHKKTDMYVLYDENSTTVGHTVIQISDKSFVFKVLRGFLMNHSKITPLSHEYRGGILLREEDRDL